MLVTVAIDNRQNAVAIANHPTHSSSTSSAPTHTHAVAHALQWLTANFPIAGKRVAIIISVELA